MNKTIGKLLKYIKSFKIWIVVSFLLAIVKVVMTLYLPILTARAIDYMIGIGRIDFFAIKKLLIKMAIVILITVIAQWLMNICNNHITYNVMHNMRNDIVKKIQRIPLSVIDKKDAGDMLSRAIADVDQVGDGLLMGFTQAFSGILTIALTLVFMLKLNIIISVAVVVLTPISFFVASFIARRSYNMFTMQSVTRGRQTAFINEIIPNEQVVQSYSYQERAIKKFDRINKRLADYSMKATFYSSITNPATRFVNNLVYAAVGVLGAVFAFNGTLSIGSLSCFLSYANQYTKPFNEISGVITELQNAIACADRIFEMLEYPEENDTDTQISDECEGKTSNDIEGNVSAEEVSFSYDKSRQILKSISFDIKKGMQVAIVGTTGCGKTTLINLIMRFYDLDSGKIKIDGNDISKMEKKMLRHSVGMVLQDTWLCSGTIAENISYGNDKATRDEIIAAAKAAYADSFIRRLPNGYDTQVKEAGNNLSQGQKQLLCIARVMLMKPSILILDEATSNIDTLTEINVCRAFNKLMEGRTSLIVAHRLSTIKNSDCILVMDNGNIIEQGSHDELLKKKGFYANLYDSQFA